MHRRILSAHRARLFFATAALLAIALVALSLLQASPAEAQLLAVVTPGLITAPPPAKPQPGLTPEPSTGNTPSPFPSIDTRGSDALQNGPTWQEQSPMQSPSPRAEMGFVYDSARNIVVAVGGTDGASLFNETWEYDGQTWNLRDDLPKSPPGRRRPAIAYNPDEQLTVMFGGSNPGDSQFFNDTWEYDGTTWVQKFPVNPPSPRNGAKMVYDPNRGRMLLFGGYRYEGGMIFFGETWEYDGAQWFQLFPAHHPEPRETVGLAYDANRGVTILFGGGREAGSVVFNDTWEWDGIDWTERSDLSISPPPRWVHAMTYDLVRKRAIVFAGLVGTTSEYDDTWEYDGTAWTQVSVSPSPPERWDAGMVYDTMANATILFGGAYYDAGFNWRGDTWHYSASLPVPERPVVLLPGVMGSKLWGDVAPGCTGDSLEIWTNLPVLFDSLTDEHLTRLALADNGYDPADDCNLISAFDLVWNLPGSGISTSLDFYATLRQYLEDSGYTVFPCPYDWRRFLEGTAPDDLPQRIDACIEAARPSSGQVDIVAHSLGGFAARAYVLSDPARAARVHSIVSLGTPYLGAPGSLLPLRYGVTENWPLDLMVANDTLEAISLNQPAVYQILPSETFFEEYPGGYFVSDGATYHEYSYMRDYLLKRDYNDYLVNKAEDLHSGPMDNWQDDGLDTIDYYLFVGQGLQTTRWVMEEPVRFFGQPLYWRQWTLYEEGGGDGTVLQRSADLGGVNDPRSGSATICYFPGVSHGGLTREAPVLSNLNQALQGLTLPEAICPPRTESIFKSSSEEVDASHQLSVHGRSLVHLWDDQGRHTGPRPDLIIENNIPAVLYHADEMQTEVGFPTTSVYTVTLEMKANLPLELRFWTTIPSVSWNTAISQTVIFQDVPSAVGGQATMIYAPLADPSTLRLHLDLDGDGHPEASMPPTDILDDEESADHEPPVTSVIVEGDHDPMGFYTGLVTVTLSATDAGTGVHRIEFSLDGGNSGIEYTGPFAVVAEHVPVVHAQAIDRAGNREYPWATARLRAFSTYLPTILKEHQ